MDNIQFKKINLFSLFNIFITYLKNFIYNLFISSYTKNLYQKFIERLPNDSIVLDIGIGNGYALIKNSKLLKEKNIKFIGIDSNKDSINYANNLINENNLEDYITVHNKNIYSFGYENIKKFEYIYISNSYSTVPDISEIINHCQINHLEDNGKIIISTTLETNYNFVKTIVKPKIKYLFFGIDFGKFLILDKFINNLNSNKFKINYIENVQTRWIPIWGNINIYNIFIKKDTETK